MAPRLGWTSFLPPLIEIGDPFVCAVLPTLLLTLVRPPYVPSAFCVGPVKKDAHYENPFL
jgi:hypothetical protein